MTTKTPEEVTLPEVVEEFALDLYQENRIKHLVEQVRNEVTSLVLDPSDPMDYKQFGSIQRKISSFKVALDAKGQEIVKPIKKQIAEVDALRKYAKDSLDRIRADFLRPRDEYDAEIAEKARTVSEAFDLFQSGWSKIGQFGEPTLDDWKRHAERIEATVIDPEVFEDRTESAIAAKAQALKATRAKIAEVEEHQRVLEAGRKALAEQGKADIPEAPPEAVQTPQKPAEATPVSIQQIAADICKAVPSVELGKARLIAHAIAAGSIRNVGIVA